MRRADFPSRLMLVAAMNPCPCGWLGSPLRSCRCTSFQVLSYRSRVSGPLLDRIDLHVELNPVEYRDLRGNGSGDSSAAIRLRVERARAKQLERQSSSAGPVWNSDLGCAGLRDHARLDEAGHALLELAATRLSLSARSIASVRRVARTIADLVGQRRIEAEHVAEALQYRRIGKEEQDAAAQPRPSKRRSGGSRAQQPNPCQDQP